jgi:chromate transporter
MNDLDELGPLAGIFTMLSVVAIGGVNTTLPELHRLVVDVHGWMSDSQFTSLYAIAQGAPGPNLMIVTLVGWHVAGFAGALVSTLGIIVPSSAIAFAVSRTWTRFREARWRKAIQAGLVPVTVGLVAASALVITGTVTGGEWRLIAVTVITATIVTFTKIHPLIPLAAAGVVGYLGVL